MKTLHDYREHTPTFNTGLQAIVRMPEFCAPITTAIMLWPLIEQSTLSMLASIVGAEAVTVVAMHAALLNESSKEQTLEAAAKTKLNEEDFALLKAILKLTKKALKERHIFAHWIPAFTPQVPGILLFLELEDTTDLIASISHNSYIETSRHIPVSPVDHKKVRAYRLEDANAACDRLKECHQYIDAFGWYHHILKLRPEIIAGMRPVPQPNEHRAWLLAQPLIRQALSGTARK